MAKKNNEANSSSSVKYIIIAVCVALIVIAGIVLGISSKKDEPKYDGSDFVVTSSVRTELGINETKYTVMQSAAKADDMDKYYVKLGIGTVSPKRFIAGNYPNTTFYTLYEDGYGYQYNSTKKENQRNNFTSELKVLDMTVVEAYWLEYNSQKIYLYFVDNNGVYNAVVSNFAF